MAHAEGFNCCLHSNAIPKLNLVGVLNFIDGRIVSKFDFNDKDNIKLKALSEEEAKAEWKRLENLPKANLNSINKDQNHEGLQRMAIKILPGIA